MAGGSRIAPDKERSLRDRKRKDGGKEAIQVRFRPLTLDRLRRFAAAEAVPMNTFIERVVEERIASLLQLELPVHLPAPVKSDTRIAADGHTYPVDPDDPRRFVRGASCVCCGPWGRR